MFQILWEEPFITTAILVFWGGSLFIRILLGNLYRGMIRQSDNMATTNNRLLKQCKLKFANCYQLNNGVSNIPVFVDKFLNRLTLGPFSFETLYHISGQSMLLSVIFSGIGSCRALLRGRGLMDIIPYYIISFVGLYLFFSVSALVNLKGKRRVLTVNLVDYLENHLSARIGVTEKDMKMLYGRKRALEVMPISARGAMAAGAELQEFPGVAETVRTDWPKIGADKAEESGGKKTGAKKIEAEETGAKKAEAEEIAAEEIEAEKIKDVQLPSPDQISPFYISEEELEALIKEFC